MMRSLHRQLTLGLLVAFLCLLGSGLALVYWTMKQSLYDQFDEALLVKARIVMTNAQQQDGLVHVYFSDRFLREFDDAVATEFFQVFYMNGNSVERSDSLEADNLPLQYGEAREPHFWNLELPNGLPGRAVGVQFQPTVSSLKPGQEPVDAIVVTAVDRKRLLQTLSDLQIILVIVGLVSLVLTIVAVNRVLHYGLRPLRQMANDVTGIDAHSLDTRLPEDGLPAEIQPISHRLNDLLDRLQDSFNREKRFSSDIAHELRTPLAELRSIAEINLKWPEDRSPDCDREFLDIAKKMERLVESLLALVRAEQSNAPLNFSNVSVPEFARDCCNQHQSLIETRNLRIDLRLEGPDLIKTEPTYFCGILSNLIENAVHYAPEGDTVEIQWLGQGNTSSLQITNTAPNLTRDDISRMFDRFWRADSSRSTTDDHSGLGLSLVATYAQVLGFSIKASLSENQRFSILLESESGSGSGSGSKRSALVL